VSDSVSGFNRSEGRGAIGGGTISARETKPCFKCALFGIILALFVTPALAANVEFYVVQNVASHKCSIKELKSSQYPSEFLPTNASMNLVGTSSYKDLGCGQGRNEGRCDLYVEASRELALLAPSGRRQSGPPGDGSSETTYALIAGRP
jgi:hypothetical protein